MKVRIGWSALLVATGLACVSLPVYAAQISCALSPSYTIITEGESIQLSASCSGGTGPNPVEKINWMIGGVSVTGDVDVSEYGVGQAINYSTPIIAGNGAGVHEFTVGVTPAEVTDTVAPINSARVVVKPSSAAVAAASELANPTTPVPAGCGSANLTAASAMPSGAAQCATGSKPAIAVSGPDAFTWSCLSLTGGAEANCYALRGFNVLAVEGSNPDKGIASPLTQPVAKGTTGLVSVSMTDTSYGPTFVSTCGGKPDINDPNKFETGQVTAADCTVTVNYSNIPIIGECGTANTASDSLGVSSQPTSNLCSKGTFAEVDDTNLMWKWGCNGNSIVGASNASCDAPKQYTVTATPGLNGKVEGGTVAVPKTVKAGSPASFQIVADTGYAVNSPTGVGCTVNPPSGSTYTTSAITANCTISATFSQQVVSLTDPGSGLWVPTPANQTWIADQSGPSNGTQTYTPGCLNGVYPPTASASGCGGLSSYSGIINGTSTNTTFTYGSGNTLGIRYMSKPTAGTSLKYFTFSNVDGGNVGQALKVWLSTSSTATYDATDVKCKLTSTTQPYIITGPGYCPIEPSKRYYLKMSVDSACPNCRFRIFENASDFN